MRIDFGRSLCLALAVVLAATLAQLSAAIAEPRIVWHVENPFRFFLDAADTHVHRATWASLSEADRRRPVSAAERVLGERHPDGWAATVFANTCWDYAANRYSCQDRRDYLNPKSHTILVRIEGLDDSQTVDCTWFTSPRGKGQRGKAVTLPCDTPVQLDVPYPGRRLGQRRDRRPAGGGGGGARHATCSSSAWATASPPARATRTCPCASRPTARPTTASAPTACALSGYPARIGDWTRDRRPEVHRGERPLAGPGLPSLALFPPAAGRAAARHRGPAPRRDVRGRGLLGRGDDLRPVPRATRATSGCPTRRTCRRSRPSPRPSAAAASARDYDLPEAYHINDRIPELKGGLVLKKCDRREARARSICCSSPSAATTSASRGCVANAVLADKSILRQARRLVRPRARLGGGHRPARRPGRSPEVGQPRAALPAACAVAGIRPRHPYRPIRRWRCWTTARRCARTGRRA